MDEAHVKRLTAEAEGLAATLDDEGKELVLMNLETRISVYRQLEELHATTEKYQETLEDGREMLRTIEENAEIVEKIRGKDDLPQDYWNEYDEAIPAKREQVRKLTKADQVIRNRIDELYEVLEMLDRSERWLQDSKS